MGVLGLWQLLAPVGQPVTLESLENKIFAVDISIWLNQAIKGYRDSQGGSLPNAHLLSLFSRLCKLLFYKIRPIIVFDGGFPELKKQTIINRQNRRAAVKQSSRDIGLKILTNYLASQNLAKETGEVTTARKIIRPKEKVREEIYELPPLPESTQDGFSESAEDLVEWKFTNFSKEDIKYLNQIDIESDDFNNLPPDVRQEILSTLKESRRHRTWEQSRELPEDSGEFSSYQMQCLLKKRNLSKKLEEVRRDLRQINAADFVAQYTSDHVLGETNKIMSDDCSHYVLLKKIMKVPGNQSSQNEKSEEASSSSMMDTKSAFIKDMENIDVIEDFPDQTSGIEIVDENSKEATLSSVMDTKSAFIKVENIDVIDDFGEQTSDIEIVDESIENVINHLNSYKEEDVDNPPEAYKTGSIKKEFSVGKELSTNSSSLVLSSEGEDNLASEMNVQNVDVKVSNTDQTVAQHSDKLVKNCSRIYPELTASYLDAENSSSEDEMIPCDEIPAESLYIENQKSLEEINLVATEATNSSTIQNLSCVSTPSSSVLPRFPVSTSVSIPSTSSVPSCVPPSSTKPSTSSESPLPSTSSEPSASPLPSTSYTSSVPSTSTTNDSLEQSSERARRNLELQNDLDTATLLLEADQAKLDRQNRTVQDHMIEECKELLRLFGIPFVVSPTEAEAQCAFYDIANLSHGTITDDSDVFLFGGKRVYKNFFTQQKYVEFYRDHEIFAHFGLSRNKLVNFALLTGSDYTEGIEGVGRVTAMEILSEFPGEGLDSLIEFKDWWSHCNKHARPPENNVRAKLLKLVLAENFPDEKVFDAYLNPDVDQSTEKFTWGRPDLDALRDYTLERFGWSKSKVDETLLPVIKKLGERDTQTHLDSFFTVTLKKQKDLFPSKRIMSALKKITSPQKAGTVDKTTKQENSKRSKTLKPKESKAKDPKGSKRKSKVAVKKTVPKKAVCRTKQSKPQGPILSEESSDED